MNKLRENFCELSEKAFYLPEEDRFTLRVAASTVKTIKKMELLQF
jgi:ribosomal protein L28